MFRLVLAFLAISSFSFCQNLPALRWAQQLDNLGADSFSGVGTDAQGNIYVTGSTASPNFPLKAPVQANLGSSGLYKVDGSAYTRLAANWVISSLAADPSNPNIFYATSPNSGLKSVDGGNTWTVLTLPSSQLRQFVVDPSNGQNVYAVAFDIGVVKSTDGGATWKVMNNGLTRCADCSIVQGDLGGFQIWIDPNSGALFLYYGNSLARSADGGVSWQTVGPSSNGYNIYFDTPNPGVLYIFTYGSGALRSTDDGQTFQGVSVPVISIFADPNQKGRLLGVGNGTFESDDDGVTWTLVSTLGATIIAADWANHVFYAQDGGSNGILQISADLKTVTPVGPAGANPRGLIVVNGHVYVPNSGGQNAYVTKLDASGNVVYSTYFGGSGNDIATAMTVDAAGNVYVAGTTTSLDFPTTKGSYSKLGQATLGQAFLFKLNPDGSVAYSTYFPSVSSTPAALAVDSAGSVYMTGITYGGVPTTPGAYQTVCGCGVTVTGFVKPALAFVYSDAFLTKFDPTGSTLVYSTYLGVYEAAGKALALGSDGSAYVGSGSNVYHLNATGSSLLAKGSPMVAVVAMATAPDGSVYLAGSTYAIQFQPTAGAFQTKAPPPTLQYQPNNGAAAIVKMDPQLQNVLAGTYFGDNAGPSVSALVLDAAGNVYIGGSTLAGLATRTPLFGGFGSGFLSEFSSDLSTLEFSTYLGNTKSFSVKGVTIGSSGSVIIGGATNQPSNVWVNSIFPAAPPALRIDSIVNVASMIDGPLSGGETIFVRGAGFGSDAQLTIGGVAVTALSISPTQIAAVVPTGLPSAVLVQVQSGGAVSNLVPVPVAVASPGIFSADGSGGGPGYIVNQDGTMNSAANPAKIGDKITIYANGIGPVSFTNGYAVSQYPANVLIEGFYCAGVAAVMGPVAGLPGSVYQITVIVPNPVDANPDLKNFVYPPLVSIVMNVASSTSQTSLSISMTQ